MHAVTGAYAKPIFVDRLGASPVCYDLYNKYYYINMITFFDTKLSLFCLIFYLFSFFLGQSCIMNGVPLEDFGHGHPDPNLT
jgi:phosphoglucomutase